MVSNYINAHSGSTTKLRELVHAIYNICCAKESQRMNPLEHEEI